MITIRLSMNGESPMISAVSGSRSGAPGIAVSSAITSEHARASPRARSAGPRASPSGDDLGGSSSSGSSPASAGSQAPSRPSTSRAVMNVSTIATKIVEDDPEVQVRGEVDVRARVDQRRRVVGDLGQHAVDRRDQEVHAEAGGDARERGRDARPAGVARRS